MSFMTKIAAAAAGLIVAGGLALAAAPAHADPSGIGVSQNTQGEAGYYANDNGHTRFRDASSTLTVTAQIKNLNGNVTSATPIPYPLANEGALGNELCDPNGSGYAAQIGIWWNGAAYQVVYGYGNFAPNTNADPCIMSGLVNPVAQTLLTNFTIHQGDRIHLDVFYQPHGRHHYVQFTACDYTQDVCRQAYAHTGWHNFFEAGIGGITAQPTLTAPALNLIDTFNAIQFNYYSARHAFNSIYTPLHWELKRADFINSSSQVVMSSNGSLNGAGNMFSLFNGSTSA